MTNFSSKLAAAGLISLAFAYSTANAQNISPQKADGFYLGLFGGGGTAGNNHISQTGTALYSSSAGGPLAVNATGNADTNSAGMGGMHFGYEWQGWHLGNSSWNVAPAAELEGYYLGITQSGNLQNPTTRLPEHTFTDSFPLHTGVVLANSIWTFDTSCMRVLSPYAGVGVGAMLMSISGANSTQTSPAEVGINHFNSNTGDSNWAFAAQAKAGLHFNIDSHWRLFAEYRYLFVSSTNFTFGSTQYPTHVATTNWNVNLGSTNYNMGVAGVEYSF